MRICVYTAITGGYDSLREIEFKNDTLDYLCFTNDKALKSDTWRIIYIDEPLDNQLLQRKIKILYFKYLSDYDASLYIDGKVTVRKDVFPFIQRYLKPDTDLVGFKHPLRDCIYDEIYFCVLYEKEHLSKGLLIQEKYKKEGFPRHYGLSDTAIMIRRHNDVVKELMESWYTMVETYSRRDQLSLFYCLWKFPKQISTVFLDDNIEDNEFFSICPYHSVQKTKYFIADFNQDGKYDPALLVEGSYMSGLPITSLNIKAPVSCESFKLRVDELGNSLLEYSTDSDLTIETLYGIPLNDQLLFLDRLSIKVSGHIEAGQIIQVNLKIKEFSRVDLLVRFYHYNSERLYLINQTQGLVKQVQDLKSSKSYKIGRAVTWLPRKLRDLLRRCCE